MPNIKLSCGSKNVPPKITFSKELTSETAPMYLDAIAAMVPKLLVSVITEAFPMMRPPSQKEVDLHTYVFMDGDKGEIENRIYKAKKSLYESLSNMFAAVLSYAFPDVEYLENCASFQQNYVYDHTEEEVKAYADEVENLVIYTREHMAEIIEEVLADAASKDSHVVEETQNNQTE